MLDLAYLGLSATNELSADPRLESPFVGLRPGLVAEEGFDRPLTWAVPVDDGKMADTQPATLATSQPAERQGGLLEIDALLEQQPVFVPSVSRQPTSAVADTTPSHANPTAKAPPTATAAESATPLPAFLQGAAPRVDMTGDAQQSMPGVAMSSYPGGGYTGPFTGPLPGGFVVGMKVQEVDFQGDAVVVQADPGRIPYPTEQGLPEWRDQNIDGVIDPATEYPGYEDKFDVVEWSVPVAYARNTSPVVSAKFQVTALGQAPHGATKHLNVRGLWRGYGVSMMCPEVTVPAEGEYVYYPPTATYSPLPDYVDSVKSADIEWQVVASCAAVS